MLDALNHSVAPWLVVLALTSASANAQTARISGVVFDSIHGTPLRHALVIATPVLSGKDTVFHGAQSDDNGRFAITALHPGEFRLVVEHPLIDSTGISARPLTLSANAGENSAALALPSVATLRRIFCPAALADTTLGVMLGTVRTENGRTVVNASVVFRWADFDMDRNTLAVNTKQVGASVRTDSLGVFRACGLPRNRLLFVQAQVTDDEQSGLLQEEIGKSGFSLRDFAISAAGTFIVDGTITGAAGEKISSGQVSLLGSEKSVQADADGRFRLLGAHSGTQALEVLALGYAPVYAKVDVSASMAPLVIHMTKSAVLLDSVQIVARRATTGTAVRYREFDHNAKYGMGRIFTEDDPLLKDAGALTEVMRHVAGVDVYHPKRSHENIILSKRGNAFNPTCRMNIFVDGTERVSWNMDDMPATAVHGIEVYVSVTDVPVKYRRENCGAIFIWTK